MSRGKCLLCRFCLRMRRRSGTLSLKATTSHAYFQREPNISPIDGVTYDMIFQIINISCITKRMPPSISISRLYVLNILYTCCHAWRKEAHQKCDVYDLSGWFKLRYDEIWCSRCFFKTFMCKQQAHIFILLVEGILSSAGLHIITKLKPGKHYQSKIYPTISCQWLQSRFLFEKKTQQQFHPNQRNTIHLMHQRPTSRPSY